MSSESDREDASCLLDRSDPLRFIRQEFVIPTIGDIKSHRLVLKGLDRNRPEPGTPADPDDSEPCVYLCGNSLGLQPRRTATRIGQYMSTWGCQGVMGHFKPLDDSPLPIWLDADARAARMISPIVGAEESEVAVMQTLTTNLHLLMSAFYRPDISGRHKIILESKAFPSDHFAVETQVRHHGLDPKTSMVTIESPFQGSESPWLSTYDVMSVISANASTTALALLPGIQYYGGQLLDIPTITAFAHKHGVFVIWDLAHAVGNVKLSLHDWDVDAAAWCSYKYLNGGPGCIGGMFVHSRSSQVRSPGGDGEEPATGGYGYVNRLGGWWGNDKSSRFAMATKFHPVPGAAGFQLSNPSILDITSLCASLEVFELAGGMAAIRKKSVALTGHLDKLLQEMPEESQRLFRSITPADPDERGAQLSLLLMDGLLEGVMKGLEARGVIVDERKPNVIRVAPAPLYNTFVDCDKFVRAFARALAEANEANAACR